MAEPLPEKLHRAFLGGYGIAARIIYEQQRASVDALGPENILVCAVGLLAGSGTSCVSRFHVAGKSPLTGTRGDANCGGFFGPELKAGVMTPSSASGAVRLSLCTSRTAADGVQDLHRVPPPGRREWRGVHETATLLRVLPLAGRHSAWCRRNAQVRLIRRLTAPRVSRPSLATRRGEGCSQHVIFIRRGDRTRSC